MEKRAVVGEVFAQHVSHVQRTRIGPLVATLVLLGQAFADSPHDSFDVAVVLGRHMIQVASDGGVQERSSARRVDDQPVLDVDVVLDLRLHVLADVACAGRERTMQSSLDVSEMPHAELLSDMLREAGLVAQRAHRLNVDALCDSLHFEGQGAPALCQNELRHAVSHLRRLPADCLKHLIVVEAIEEGALGLLVESQLVEELIEAGVESNLFLDALCERHRQSVLQKRSIVHADRLQHLEAVQRLGWGDGHLGAAERVDEPGHERFHRREYYDCPMDAQDLRLQPVPKRIKEAYAGAAPAVSAFRSDLLSYEDLFRLRRELGIPEELSLRVGRDFDISHYGVLGYAMMSAATLAQAVQIAVRYHRTAEPLLTVNMRSDAKQVYVLLENSYHLDTDFYRSVVEEMIGTFPSLWETLTGKVILPERLMVAYPDPGYSAVYADVFGRLPQFDAVETAYAISKTAMSLPLVKADASTFALLEQSCRELLEEIRQAENFTNSVREVLLREMSSVNTAADVAQHLNVSERTVRRKLANENTAFHELVDDVRTRLAKDYLSGTEMTAQEIAELLGYTEASNFRRAFVRWTHVTPQRYRRQTVRVR